MSHLTVPALIDDSARRFGDSPAVVDGDQRLTYADLAAESRRTARAYLAAGVRPGDRVAIWAPNRLEFVLALLGAQVIGASVVPLNTRYRGREARVVLERARASALVLVNGFLGADYFTMLTESVEDGTESGEGPVAGLPHLHTVVDLGSTGQEGTIGWDRFLAGAESVTPEALAEAEATVTSETVCDILYTSGTTGLPKGVMSAHRQTIGVADVWATGASLTEADRYAIVNPFFHSFGYKAGIMACLTAGTTIYPVRTFDPPELMAFIESERITVLPGAPTIFLTLINHPRLADFDLSSLRFSIAGAASVPETLFKEMLEVLGFDQVAQAYGLTECVVATQSRPNEDPLHVAETTGPACPGIEVRTVDAEGDDVAVGADGEILLRGDNVMLGYFEDEAATAEAIDPDGWLHTGDVGRLDEHGCLKITDRIKDMFTVGGFNVYPAEIEGVLTSHPDVVECAVIGIPDERMGSVGRAYVVPRPGATIDVAALTAYCKTRLANFKVPREIVTVAEFPRNASGKILKRDLRDDA
ncbi:FadD3 family acyl-CoA ligase [Nocardioides sp. Root140]|uniref:FadD3 family acyl-CoA ligase n=1 Tax=Nocardioides sp. Root140 TaxID=1736460 RepID=UPI0006FA5A65|nr:FadD3 family acyl-CoA ligase [Nocardioides sp. Root140]KQY54263.1 fatty acid--CoA ligase [Nocardioides sp. Root140]